MYIHSELSKNSTISRESTASKSELILWIKIQVENIEILLDNNKVLASDDIRCKLENWLNTVPKNCIHNEETPELTDDQVKVKPSLEENLKKLTIELETNIQNLISKTFCFNFNALDTKEVQVMYELPLKSTMNVTRTGKPDFSSTISPTFLELKSGGNSGKATDKTYEVLLQAVNRSCAIGQHFQGILKRVTVFATDGNFLFRVKFGANDNSLYNDSTMNISLFRIAVDRFQISDFLHLWVEDQKLDFYHEHRDILLAYYLKIGIDWRLTRSQVLRKTDRSCLYNIWITKDGKNFISTREHIDFIVKIGIANSNKFNEATALKHLKLKYVIGVIDEGDYLRVHDYNIAPKEIQSTYQQKEFLKNILWWENISFNESNANKFWIITMKVCNLLDSYNTNWTQLFVQIYEQLSLAHSINIVHCDLRSSNIMVLDNSYVLIDWDLSTRINVHQQLHRGARYEERPVSLISTSPHDKNVIWTPKDDFAMLSELVIRKIVSMMFIM